MFIKNQEQFFSGLMFLVFGVLGMILSQGYRLGTAMHMGPGYFPFLLSFILSLLGLGMIVQGLISKTKGATITKIRFKAIFLIIGSVVAFAVLLEKLGFIAAIFVLVLVSSLPSQKFRWKTGIILAVALSLISVGIFVWALELRIQMWPTFIQQ